MGAFSLIKPYFRENLVKILIGLSCLVGVDLLQLFIPRILKWTIDDLTAYAVTAAGLLRYGLMVVAAAVMIGLFRYVWRRCLIGLSRRVEEGLRNRLFAHIQTLSASYFAKASTGDLMAHATNDIGNIRMASGMGLVALTDAVVLGGAAVGFMLYIDPQLTLFALIPMPFVTIFTKIFSRRMHRNYMRVQGAFADLTEAVREGVAGIRIVKAFNMEERERRKVADLSEAYVERNMRLVRITGALFPMMVLFTNISLAAVLWFGGGLTIENRITPGDLVAFISYLSLLTWPMMALGWVTNLIQRGRASLDRIGRILAEEPEILDAPDALAVREPVGKLTFQNVSFSYDRQKEGATETLSGIDLTVPAGTILGMAGPPGSGKTTLLNMVQRFYVPTAGNILLDGVPLSKLKLAELRSQIAFVPQEPYLFSGSIRDNILLGNEGREDLLSIALQRAALEETVANLPDGLDTVVGEKGVILSGGQKQRVAIARALVQERKILVLDDPISQVDMETGAKVIGTLRQMAQGRTVIIASHRFSALDWADRIVVLDAGKITESGNHEQLMERGGYYAGIHRFQSVEEDRHAG